MEEHTPTHSDETAPDFLSAPWQCYVLNILGFHWALNLLFPALIHGINAPLGFLPLLGFAAPFLWRAGKGWRRAAFWLCIFETALSPLLWFVSMSYFMNPLGMHVSVLSIPIFTVWSPAGQFLFFGIRGLVFASAAALIYTMPMPLKKSGTA